MGNFQELSDLNKTIKISARRFEESPYIERTKSPDRSEAFMLEDILQFL